MNLNDYLECLRTCPDIMIDGESALSKHFGVWDNYDIMLNARIGQVVEEFCVLTDFSLRDTRGGFWFDYAPKVVGVHILPNKLMNEEIFRKHPVLIMLHPRHLYEKTTNAGYSLIDQHRNIAEVIQMIGRYVLCDKIRALFRGSYLTMPEDILEGKKVVVYDPVNT